MGELTDPPLVGKLPFSNSIGQKEMHSEDGQSYVVQVAPRSWEAWFQGTKLDTLPTREKARDAIRAKKDGKLEVTTYQIRVGERSLLLVRDEEFHTLWTIRDHVHGIPKNYVWTKAGRWLHELNLRPRSAAWCERTLWRLPAARAEVWRLLSPVPSESPKESAPALPDVREGC